jgi:hypothetical protein
MFVGFYYLLFSLFIVLAVFLIILLIKLNSIGHGTMAKKTVKAKKLLEAGKGEAALVLLYRSLSANGWDYQNFLTKKRLNKLASITEAESVFVKIARFLRILPKNNLDWTLDGLYLLGDIYLALNQPANRARLLNDLKNFIDDSGGVLSRIVRTDYLSRINYEQAKIELEARNYRSAAHLEAAGYLNQVENLHAKGDSLSLQKIFPYQPTEVMRQAMSGLGREKDEELVELSRVIQTGVVDGGARIDLTRVVRDIDDLFKGRQTQTSRDSEMAKILYRKVLEKAGSEPTPDGNDGGGAISL